MVASLCGEPATPSTQSTPASASRGSKRLPGPPQSDATIKEAREVVGPELTIWGGIPQNFLLKTYSEEQFESAVREAIQQAQGDRRVILGIADRVSVDSDFGRLKDTARLIAEAGIAQAS